MHITDWSITPGDNTSIDGLSIAPGAAARNVGGALRAIMAGVKAVADESGEAEQFFEDHPSYMVSGKGGYLLDIAPSAAGWGDYLTALAKDYASADRGALRIPYTATRMCHVLTFTSGTEVTVYIPSQRLIRTYTYSTGEWTDTGAETLPEALGRLTSAESTIAAHTSELSDIKTSMAALGADSVHKTGDETISGAKTFTEKLFLAPKEDDRWLQTYIYGAENTLSLKIQNRIEPEDLTGELPARSSITLQGEDSGQGRFTLLAQSKRSSTGDRYKQWELLGTSDGTLKWTGGNYSSRGDIEIVDSKDFSSSTRYIRYSSGLQICWGILNINGPVTSKNKRVTFPVAFSKKPAILTTYNVNIGNKPVGTGWESTTAFSIGTMDKSNSTGSTSWIAIGPWK